MQDRRLRLLTYFIMGYMLLAFVWWSVLLIAKNKDAFLAKSELQQIGLAAEGLIQTPEDFYRSDRYEALFKDYKRQENMIMGEALFLSLSLLAGIYLIYRGYQREVSVSQQQRNFLLSITHELKSPLAGIRLALETILKRSDRLNPQQIEGLSIRGVKEADRLNKLVEDLLLSARLENAYQFHYEPIDLAEMTIRLTNKLEQQHQKLNITTNINTEFPYIKGDRQALTSVLLNLLENAVKYSPSPAQIKVDLLSLGDKLELRIADQGYGISNTEKKRIFEKFYRVGNEDTRTTKGTGLGLFIVRELVKSHQGTINIIDNKPHGSVFILQLPVMVD